MRISRVLEGGNAAWKGPTESGVERATTTRDDVWYKPYDHASDYKKHARDYLTGRSRWWSRSSATRRSASAPTRVYVRIGSTDAGVPSRADLRHRLGFRDAGTTGSADP